MTDEAGVIIIVIRQKAIAEELENAIKNFKKDSASRKTQRYKEERLRRIKEIWDEFSQNHEKIKTVVKEETPYIQRNTFAKVKEMYEAFKLQLESIVPIEGETMSLPTTSKTTDKPVENNLQTQRLQKIRLKKDAIISNIEDFEETFDNYTKEMCDYQQKILLEQLRSLTEIHEEFMINATERDLCSPYVKQKEYNDVKKDINQCLHRMASKLGEANEPTPNTTRPSEARLPQLKIPTFRGNYLEWRSFCDLFSTMIHNRASLNVTEKMEYLKTHLELEPLQLIQHLTISSENYQTAWETLKSRYENERKIVSLHIDKMFKTGQPSSPASASAIKNTLDATKEGLAALTNMGFDTSSWGPIIVHMTTKALDSESRNLFELSLEKPNKMPSLDALLSFLQRRYQALEVLAPMKQKQQRIEDNSMRVRNFHIAKMTNCVFCKGDHNIYSCQKFMSWTPKERYEQAKLAKLCINCLRHDKQSQCMSKNTCRSCNKKHHSLLHIEASERSTRLRSAENLLPNSSGSSKVLVTHSNQKQNILLATALVRAYNNNGQSRILRALIDPGSQATLVTEEVAQTLQLKKEKVFVEVSGLGATDAGVARNRVELMILPRFESEFNIRVQALVLPKLTRLLPSEEAGKAVTNRFKTLMLADPTFNAPGRIDMIIGADIYGDIMLDGLKKGPRCSPVAQRSNLGWLITGRTPAKSSDDNRITGMVVQTSLEKQIERFWELEKVADQNHQTPDDQKCEEIYEKTHYRDSDGRYVVCIPFNPELKQTHKLGESRNKAIARLRQLESKFATNEELKKEYTSFMKQFIDLGHMVEVLPSDKPQAQKYYMPHHAVHKPDSTTTKLRVVFDGSAKTSTGVSLNNLMLVGPRLQEDLTTIIIRWRRHKYVFTADIEKMYRQIKMSDDHQDYQRIVWRDPGSSKIKEYKITTVTYGTASAPYLAIKTLKQLAIDEQERYPIASEIVTNDFYVDDMMSGRGTLKDCREAQAQLTAMLKEAGFNLRKWSSNNIELLTDISPEAQHQRDIEIDKEETIKTLGIHWSPAADTFQFKVNINDQKGEQISTKRITLSEIAKLYDPLGWLAPITIGAKLLMQQLWKSSLDWDEPLTAELQQTWSSFKNNLVAVGDIRIPRWIGTNKSQKMELHGFCDASETAYAAVVYSRVRLRNGTYRCTLLTAKTKVAPIKKKITLPKLELCGAHLLSKVLQKLNRIFGSEVDSVFAWTDSTIALAWIRGCPSKWKTFVANRVSQIQEVTDPSSWRHLSSVDNPADCASRGITPDKLKNHQLWWYGPEWLKGPVISRSSEDIEDIIIPESKVVLASLVVKENMFERFSSYNRLIRVVAYCRRFISNCRAEKRTEFLTKIELENARKTVIRIVQQEAFPEELSCLKRGTILSTKSKLLALSPRLDEDNILIVGGRLENSNLPETEKHPYILPRNDHFTKLLVEMIHKRTLHGGIQVTMATLRQSYWVLQAKNVVRQVIYKCVRCHRFSAATKGQIMGILPTPRVTPSRPFTHTGIDYAGPIQILVSKGRGNRTSKGYIAVFVCLATKAIHIELVSDLTSEAFLAALRRFISRRGICSHIYSDCGTTFVGASKEITSLMKLTFKQSEKEIAEKLALDGIEWHFIPPASPHFGGLWEAGVKSIKYHLKRIVGDTTLTFEELQTLLTQIEACLNSRPLVSLTNDIDDNLVLTPGHFLIGSSINALPEPIIDQSRSLRSRWRLIQKMTQNFWKIWSTEYLSHLQQRSKWKQRESNIHIGDIVLLKDDRLPPTKWMLGKISEIHPGKDKEVRAVTVFSNDKYMKRPITKLCPLPIEDNSNIARDNEPGQSSRNKTRRNDGVGSKFVNSLLLVSLMATLIPSTASQTQQTYNELEITQFSSQPGIFFEDVGSANMIAGSWKAVVYFNLTNYWSEFYTYKECIRQMSELCNNNELAENNDMLCETTLTQFKRQLQQIELNNDILLHANSGPVQRSKRSPFDIIGTVANELFGVLDQRFAQRYEDTIQNVRNNENHIMELMKNQTTIIDSTLNVFKEEHESTQKQLKQLTELINNLKNQTNKYNTFRRFTSTALTTILIMINYQNTQSILLDVLLSTHNGKIHPLILSVQQLNNELLRIHDNIPRTMMIPGERHHESILQLYKELHPKGRVMGNNIIIEITLPLLYNKEFKVFNVLPVPTRHNENFTFIVPSSDYLLVNPEKDHYYPMTKAEFASCNKRSTNTYWCNLQHPVFTGSSSVSSCEMSILHHNMNLSPSCVTRNIPAKAYWIEMNHPNTWIFSMPRETNIDIICNFNTRTSTISGSGILRLQPGCVIRQETIIIIGKQAITNRRDASIMPTTNLSQQLTDFRHIQEESPVLQADLTQKMIHLEHAIQIQKDQEHFLETIRTHKIQHYTILGSAAIVLIIVAMFILIRQQCVQRRPPQAAVRTQQPRRIEVPVEISLDDADFCVTSP